VADEVDVSWPVEEIPNDDHLYLRVYKKHCSNGRIMPIAFKRHGETGDGLSVDWSRYASPEDTRRRSLRHPPEDYAVVSFKVEDIRRLGYTVVHKPLSPGNLGATTEGNRAHTEIIPPATVLDTEFRAKLLALCKLEVPDDLDAFGSGD
jgi:hypothetical protein